MIHRRRFLAASAGTLLAATMPGPLLAAQEAGAGAAEAPPAWPPRGGATQMPRERVLGQTAIPVHGYKVVATYPHDRFSYTEGLVKVGGSIYEGSGLYGRSKLMEWDLKSGRLLKEHDLAPNIFGEGVTVLNGRIYQLTYLDNVAYVYDQATFEEIAERRYSTQGWGLTHDGINLLMSDGSSTIELRDPETFEVARRFSVSDAVGPVGFLNELEYAEGTLYANVWQSEFIAMIDPAEGRLTGWIDLKGLNPDPQALIYPFVLNGIAFDEDTGHLLVTGKCWPHVWEIALTPRQS